jgi:hypothetical protein
MEFLAVSFISAALLGLGMAGSTESGFRVGRRRLGKDPEKKVEGFGAVESSFFSI